MSSSGDHQPIPMQDEASLNTGSGLLGLPQVPIQHRPRSKVAASADDEVGPPIKLKNSLSTSQRVELQTRLLPAIEDVIRRFAKRNRVSTTSVWKQLGRQGRDIRKRNANAWNNFRRLEGPRLSNQGLTSQEVCNMLMTRYRALTKEEREIYRFKDIESSEDSGDDIEVDDPFADIENLEEPTSLPITDLKPEPAMVKAEHGTGEHATSNGDTTVVSGTGASNGVTNTKKLTIGSRTLSKLERATADMASYLHYLEEFYGIQGLTILSTTENLEGPSTRHPISVTIGGPLAHKFDDAHRGTLRRSWREYVNAKRRAIAESSLPDEQ